MLTLLLDQDTRPDEDIILAAITKAADADHQGDTTFKIGVVNLDATMYRVVGGNYAEMTRIGDALTA